MARFDLTFWRSSLPFCGGFYTLCGNINKLLFSLKGTELSNSSVKLKTMEVGEEEDDQLVGFDGNGFGESAVFGFEEPECFLSFRFRSYEEVVGKEADGRLSELSSDDEFYDPCFDDQLGEEFDGSLFDEVAKTEIGDHPCENSDSPRDYPKAECFQQLSGEDLVADKGIDNHCENMDEAPVVLKAESVLGDGEEEGEAEKGIDDCKNLDGDEDDKAAMGDGDHYESSDDYHVYEDLKGIKGDDSCENLNDHRVPENIKHFADEDEDEFDMSSGSDSDSVVSSSNFSIRSSLIDSMNGVYLSDVDDFQGKIDLSMLKVELDNKLSLEEVEFQELSKRYENDDLVEELEELLVELVDIEKEVAMEKHEDKDLRTEEENSAKEKALDWEEEEEDEDEEEEEEESNGMETQWEHQDLIEQLRMEIGKVRAVGLPTIFEDAETPKVADDLKPWKIDEKLFRTGGTMDEVHKFYKSYRERMRKFDIFNYQKMYAIGFLRLKDPLQAISPQKILLSTIISQDCWPCKPKSSSTSTNSMLKLTRDLESDLETVYVGQLCLSWEFLCWEYGKALALWDTDPHEVRRFTEVSVEFQQFQVLLQRFLEDEPFRGSGRVHYFAKNRCINRRLLQVPVIREDSLKDKMKQVRAGNTSKDAVTSVVLIEMIEGCIRLLWQLARTDKDSAPSGVLNFRKESHTELQNSDDAALLVEVQETLRKKQKKLKELIRSECCILKKLQRNRTKQDYPGRVLNFFCEVDTKLVSRVLNMTRLTTDQLAWCSGKLDNIEFVGNRIQRDPSFLLFPCS